MPCNVDEAAHRSGEVHRIERREPGLRRPRRAPLRYAAPWRCVGTPPGPPRRATRSTLRALQRRRRARDRARSRRARCARTSHVRAVERGCLASTCAESRRAGLGVELVAVIDGALEAIVAAPLVHPLWRPSRPYRMKVVQRFPYVMRAALVHRRGSRRPVASRVGRSVSLQRVAALARSDVISDSDCTKRGDRSPVRSSM